MSEVDTGAPEDTVPLWAPDSFDPIWADDEVEPLGVPGERDAPAPRAAIQHHKCCLPFGGAAGLGDATVHRQTVAVLHHGMADIAESGGLAIALLTPKRPPLLQQPARAAIHFLRLDGTFYYTWAVREGRKHCLLWPAALAPLRR